MEITSSQILVYAHSPSLLSALSNPCLRPSATSLSCHKGVFAERFCRLRTQQAVRRKRMQTGVGTEHSGERCRGSNMWLYPVSRHRQVRIKQNIVFLMSAVRPLLGTSNQEQSGRAGSFECGYCSGQCIFCCRSTHKKGPCANLDVTRLFLDCCVKNKNMLYLYAISPACYVIKGMNTKKY